MLAVAPLRDTCRDENQGEVERFSIGHGVVGEDLPDFGDGNLLDSIDFDDLFIGINVDGDVLPDLEMDPELLADFSASVSGGEEYSDMNTSSASAAAVHQKSEDVIEATKKEDDDKVSGTTSGSAGSTTTRGDQEIISKREDERVGSRNNTISQKESRKSSSSSAQSKNSQGKRKVKVDWTPELHRRFVQAVEQLGVDKAVPSRILELMGIDCLTRHNIASHLQKYRSHRKHLLAREAEAASWTQRRQMYGSVATIAAGGGVPKREMNPWIAPTMGFPPITPMHHHHPPHHFRPLHVWGHPTMDQSLLHMWPKHSPSPSPPPTVWPPVPPPPDPSYWNHPHNHQRVPNALTPGTPCFPQPLAPTRFGALPVPGIPPHAMYKVEPGIGAPTATEQSGPHPLFDFHPSKESVDAAIEDVLSKPWLPLPLGLKPPSIDSVMVELQRQGVPKIPPSSSSSCTA